MYACSMYAKMFTGGFGQFNANQYVLSQPSLSQPSQFLVQVQHARTRRPATRACTIINAHNDDDNHDNDDNDANNDDNDNDSNNDNHNDNNVDTNNNDNNDNIIIS